MVNNVIAIPSGKLLSVVSGLFAQAEQAAPELGTITVGSFELIESSSIYVVSVCVLDSTHAIMCYSINIKDLYACCLTRSGNTITAGTPLPVEVNLSNTVYVSVVPLDTTHAVVCYARGSVGRACYLTLTGDVVTKEDPVTFLTDGAGYVTATRMDSTHVIVCSRFASSSIRAYCLTVSGGTITPGDYATIASVDGNFLSVSSFDSATAVICYRDSTNSNKGMACKLALSGDAVTPGTPVEYWTGGSYIEGISTCTMDATHVIASGVAANNIPAKTYVNCLTLSGGSIVPESSVQVTAVSSANTSICSLDSTHALLVHRVSDGGYKARAWLLKLTGEVVSAVSYADYIDYFITYHSVAAFGTNNAVVGFGDGSTSNWCTAVPIAVS